MSREAKPIWKAQKANNLKGQCKTTQEGDQISRSDSTQLEAQSLKETGPTEIVSPVP
jgi:hypothetical protein